MSLDAKLNHDVSILQQYFDKFIGTQNETGLVDVVVTDSMIKEMQVLANNKQQICGYLEAKDINFVLSNGKYRTYRVPAKQWDKTISTMKQMVADDFDLLTAQIDGFIKPEEAVLKPAINNRWYGQAVVMQYLGCEWPVSVLFASDEFVAQYEGITDGEMAGLELKFEKLGGQIADVLKRVKANLIVLSNDPDRPADHNLYYANFIDFDKKQIGVSLTKRGYLKPTEDEAIVPEQFNLDDWASASTYSADALNRMAHIWKGVNQYIVDNFSVDADTHPVKRFMIERMFTSIWGQLMPMAEPVYTMRIDAFGKELDDAMESILQVVADSCNTPGLDLTSWKVYDYTNVDEPVYVTSVEDMIFDKYVNEFAMFLYQRLLNSRHPLVRPYSVKKVITDADDLAAHAIGSVRTERF